MKSKNSKVRFLAFLSCLVLVVSMLVPSTMPALKVSASTSTQPIKIMPLGDSITDCDFWRTPLTNKLKDNGYNVKFVGSRGTHEGHSGMLVTDLSEKTDLSTWLSASTPDMVMMLFGTNDCWCNRGATAILKAYTILVNQMRAYKPDMTIIIGKVTPLYPNFTSNFVYRVEELNDAMDDWAKEMSTVESPIILCDQFTGFDALTDTYDGCHPNTSGSAKMAEKWYETLSAVLDGTPVPTPTIVPTKTPDPTVTPSLVPSVTPTPSVSATPTATVSETPAPTATASQTPVPTQVVTPTPTPNTDSPLEITTDVNSWGTGYTMNITLKNTSEDAFDNWKLVLSKSDFNIANMWCAEYTQTDDSYIVTPMSWNNSIRGNDSITFGLQGIGAPATSPVIIQE